MRLADYFDAVAANFPRHEAFVDGRTRLVYKEAQAMVHATAHALTREPGLRDGAHIAIYAPNDYRISLLQTAVNRADMVWVALHTRNSPATNLAMLGYADCDLIFFHSSFEHLVPSWKADLSQVQRFICIDRPSEHGEFLDTWIAAHREPYVAMPEDPQRATVLQPTGGTTGPSKGALHSHRSLEMTLISIFDMLKIDSGSRILAVAPLTHAAAMITLAGAARGACTVVLPGFDAQAVLATIERERITHLFMPPTVVYALLATPQVAMTDLSPLRCLAVGAAPIAPEKLKEAVRVFGPVIYEVYGQSECLFPVVAKQPEDYIRADGSFDEEALRSAGRAVPYARVEIMDDDGKLLAPGEKGEIVVRSSMVMKGYYKKPEETAEVSGFGWHHTTDVGIKDARGLITIVDRKKDMIVSGGFNVFPSEIEAVINTHPAVLDCAVVGVPDEKWGEAVKAVIQLKPGHQASGDELISLCKRELGSVKTPKSIEFWDELPRSAVGKVLKRDIREKYWQGQWRSV
ncbi:MULTISPECIES: class I adenylate-forming enzyme family protein [Noviherbaspirillum]|uniref:Long-chain fatty acid--CoA ligase n=1 Tax=Noviherbaspirillum galbum TaxID=2709383 RepID=A0A6B3SZ44_9BURK|nr:AMP-binding protein [Noviherbaspirillum galbum]NEX63639.1 long-chain fatty acid--CoA ligase [Noviherbaspirillum galbum]